jgi:hypothetical protein
MTSSIAATRISSSVAPEWAPVPTTNAVGHSSAAKSGPGVLSRVSHRERGVMRPPDEDRAFDAGRVDHPSDVVDGRLYGVVGRSARLPARPGVEPHRAVLPVETADDAAPVLDGAEAAAEEEQGGVPPGASTA